MVFFINFIKLGIFYLYLYLYINIFGLKKLRNYDLIDLASLILISFIMLNSFSDNTFNLTFIFYLIIIFIIKIVITIFLTNENKDLNKIILNGRLRLIPLIKSRYSITKLYKELNKLNIGIKDIKEAVINENKEIDITLQSEVTDSIILISNGKINYELLNKIGKDKKWLFDSINDIDNVFLSIYKNNNLYVIKNSDLK